MATEMALSRNPIHQLCPAFENLLKKSGTSFQLDQPPPATIGIIQLVIDIKFILPDPLPKNPFQIVLHDPILLPPIDPAALEKDLKKQMKKEKKKQRKNRKKYNSNNTSIIENKSEDIHERVPKQYIEELGTQSLLQIFLDFFKTLGKHSKQKLTELEKHSKKRTS